MKDNKYRIQSRLFFSAIAGISAIILFAPISGYAAAADEELIMRLRAQIAALQRQINNFPPQSAVLTAPPASVSREPVSSSGDELTTPLNFSFSRDLFFGMRADTDVMNLQEFLSEHSYYSGQSTGNFFLLTFKAVKQFQNANNISPTGFFGPRSRAIANDLIGKELGGSANPACTKPISCAAPLAIGCAYQNATDCSCGTIVCKDASQSRLSIDPASAQLAIGEGVRVKAVFMPPQPPCSYANPPCMMPVRASYEVDASFTSDNPGVAAVDMTQDKTCAPPRMCPVASTPYYSVRGVSAGDAVITAMYADVQGAYAGQMKVTVGALPSVSIDCAKEPANSQNSCWQTAAQQKGDSTLCRNITVPNIFFSQDSCINAVAQAKKDSALCASIANTSIKQGCVSSITTGDLFPFPLPRASSTP